MQVAPGWGFLVKMTATQQMQASVQPVALARACAAAVAVSDAQLPV